MEKEQSSLFKKWWFWVCITSVVIVGFFSWVTVMAINKVNSNVISNINMQIQGVYKDATLYSSDANMLVLVLRHYDSSDKTMFKDIIDIIKNNLDTTLKEYDKLTILQYLSNDKEDENLLVSSMHSLPDFEELERLEYVDYNIYENTMNNYTDLFNSIGR